MKPKKLSGVDATMYCIFTIPILGLHSSVNVKNLASSYVQ